MLYSWEYELNKMESKMNQIEEQPSVMDFRIAIEELQLRNIAFEERFASLGDVLAQINSGLQGLQTAVQDLVFKCQR